MLANMFRATALMFLLCAPTVSAAQTPSDTVEWDVTEGLSATDKKDIVALTRRLGFTPRRVGPWPPSPVMSPLDALGCEQLRVETTITVNGPRRSSKSILIVKLAKEDGKKCAALLSKAAQAGGWVADRDLIFDDIKWRFQEPDFTLDVYLGENVAYDDARRIVRAIHQRTWTRKAPFERTAPWSDPDLSSIHSITRDPRRGTDYQVGFAPNSSTGETWEVRFTDSSVEFFAYHLVYY